MTPLKYFILAAIIAAIVLAYIYLPKALFGLACLIGGMVIHNNWNAIVRAARK